MCIEVLGIEILCMETECKQKRWYEVPRFKVHVVNVVTEMHIEVRGKYGSRSVLLLTHYVY